MSHHGTVNYHVHKPERQAFEIDAGGVVGCLVSPELVPTEVCVHDVRCGETEVSFRQDSVAFQTFPSAVSDFTGKGWQETYDGELTALLQKSLGAKEVVVFDHTVRASDPELRERLRPDHQPLYKRLIFSPDYYEAIQHPNARLVTEEIAQIEAEGIRTRDGELHELEV